MQGHDLDRRIFLGKGVEALVQCMERVERKGGWFRGNGVSCPINVKFETLMLVTQACFACELSRGLRDALALEPVLCFGFQFAERRLHQNEIDIRRRLEPGAGVIRAQL